MYGRPPTDRNARIDEFTPPGMTADDRSNMTSLEGNPAPVQTVGVHPAATQRSGSQNGITSA